MSQALNRETVKEGLYTYTRPGWDRTINVKVYFEPGRETLVMEFKEGFIPPLVRDCPVDAIFTKRDE